VFIVDTVKQTAAPGLQRGLEAENLGLATCENTARTRVVRNLSVETFRHFGKIFFHSREAPFQEEEVAFAKVEVALHLFDESLFAGFGWNGGRHLGDNTTGRRARKPRRGSRRRRW